MHNPGTPAMLPTRPITFLVKTPNTTDRTHHLLSSLLTRHFALPNQPSKTKTARELLQALGSLSTGRLSYTFPTFTSINPNWLYPESNQRNYMLQVLY